MVEHMKNYLYVTNISSSLNHDDKFHVFEPPPRPFSSYLPLLIILYTAGDRISHA